MHWVILEMMLGPIDIDILHTKVKFTVAWWITNVIIYKKKYKYDHERLLEWLLYKLYKHLFINLKKRKTEYNKWPALRIFRHY